MGDFLAFKVSGTIVCKIIMIFNKKKNAFIFCQICYTCVHFIVKLPYRGPYTCLISVNLIFVHMR